jgi:xanthine dehydrogenase YagS FAD-binding subunit
MHAFAYQRASDERAAIATGTRPGAAFIAGGTDLMQLWKLGAAAPALIVDISRLPLDRIEAREGVMVLGALARMSDAANHPLVRDNAPAIAEALLASASPQVRNMASLGGNLLQRTRCGYFRGAEFPCNKRRPGSGCAAFDGENRPHAIFGASSQCAATHPSDLAVALVALEARVRLRGTAGDRVLPVDDFFLLPGDRPERDTALAIGEMLVEIEVPLTARARRSRYLKIRDRASFEFALLSVAVAIESDMRGVTAIRVAAGGVGTKPWRLTACETALVGAPLDDAALRAAAEHAAVGARPLSGNAFKLDLLKRAVFRALVEARGDA